MTDSDVPLASKGKLTENRCLQQRIMVWSDVNIVNNL